MESIINLNSLLAANLVLLGALFSYLLAKVRSHRNVSYLLVSLTPLVAFELGSHLFASASNSSRGAQLIVLGLVLTPITLVPASHTIGRASPQDRPNSWLIFYGVQVILFFFVVREIFVGGIIEWVTGILEQPIVIIDKTWRYYFLNVIASNVLALLSLDRTLHTANKSQQEKLKYIFVAFLGFAVYFSYVSVNIIFSSYIPQSAVQLGAFIILFGLVFLAYGFAKYPLWEVKIRVSRRVIFGSLSATAALIYLFISGTILDVLRVLQPEHINALLPAAIFTLGTLFLFVYLSPHLHSHFRSFITRNFFRNKYDYRDLWMRFSEKSSGSLNIRDLLPPVAEFVADAMFVPQVAFWLRSPTSETYHLEYCHNALSPDRAVASSLRVDRSRRKDTNSCVFRVPAEEHSPAASEFPVDGIPVLKTLGIQRIVWVEKGGEGLALMGIGAQGDEENISAEDDQFLSSVSNQLSHLILTHKISEELLLAREWDSFNRFASFIMHDLKNLATLQGMTLENAKSLRHNPNFVSDAFATFHQTTEKMINLIASLSVQRGQFSLKQQPVNILEVLANTFDDLKINQRNGVQVLTAFPPKEKLPIITGDPELLQKAFTNLLLNAIQSLPRGEGAVEITVSQKNQGKITASIRDTGCGIPPERLESLFRPFQTTKEKGLGIGLCHTRSIIEVHGGQIRIESQVNAGTKVEVELPAI